MKYVRKLIWREKDCIVSLYMKQFIDGTPANFTGMLLEDYSDNPGEKARLLLTLTRWRQE